MELRPYQRASVDALYAYWREGGGSPLLVLPTGAGKSLVAATIVRELLEGWPEMRIGVVTHVKELIAQNFMELMRLWPSAPAGVHSAGLGRRDLRSKVLFMGIQSVWRRTAELGAFDVLLVDEAHLIPRDADTMYGKFIAALRERTPDMRLVGLTATPYRLDSGRLDDGDGSLFDAIAYEANVKDLIEQGYLSPLISKAPGQEIDVGGVHRRAGDFIPAELEAAAMADGMVQANVKEMVAHGQERRAWIVFCAGVEHAKAVRDEVRAYGFTCETVTGEMEAKERDATIRAFRQGQIRCLTSVGVLTTGFNVPHVDLISLMRPTQSAGLYVQSVGRGFRLAEGKENCLVLDFAGNVRRHGPVDMVEIKAPGEGDGEAPVKECPDCHSYVHAALRLCLDCGHEFPAPDPEDKLEAAADTTPILSGALQPPEEVGVTDWEGRLHTPRDPDKPVSLCVTYYGGMLAYREWVCPEHEGFARAKFEKWWRQHGGHTPAPTSVIDAQSRWGELTMPVALKVRRKDKFWDIMGRTFAPVGEAA